MGVIQRLSTFPAELVFFLGLVKLFQGERVLFYGFFVYSEYNTGVRVFRPGFCRDVVSRGYRSVTNFGLRCAFDLSAFSDEAENFVIKYVSPFFAPR